MNHRGKYIRVRSDLYSPGRYGSQPGDLRVFRPGNF